MRFIYKTLWKKEKIAVTDIIILAVRDLSSPNDLNLNWHKIFLFAKELTLYRTMPTFKDLEKEAF